MKSSLVYRKLKVMIQSVNKHEHSARSEISRQAVEGTEYLINFGLYIPNFALLQLESYDPLGNGDDLSRLMGGTEREMGDRSARLSCLNLFMKLVQSFNAEMRNVLFFGKISLPMKVKRQSKPAQNCHKYMMRHLSHLNLSGNPTNGGQTSPSSQVSDARKVIKTIQETKLPVSSQVVHVLIAKRTRMVTTLVLEAARR